MKRELVSFGRMAGVFGLALLLYSPSAKGETDGAEPHTFTTLLDAYGDATFAEHSG